MAHSKSKNWIHLIFRTKNSAPLITSEVEHFIHEQIKHQFIKMKCPIDCVNGMSDHIHALFLLHPQKSLSEVIQTVKGGSSYTINKSNKLQFKFSWSRGYAAYSVSESAVPIVRRYIHNQKQHHKKRSPHQ